MNAKFETDEAKNKLLNWAMDGSDEKNWYTLDGVNYKGIKGGSRYPLTLSSKESSSPNPNPIPQ